MSFTSICIEYVWIDGDYGLRSKMKCITNINEENINLNDYEKLKWNYDGSSTDQAETKSSEVILNPVKLYENKYKDYQYYKEFGSNNIKHYLLLCESVNENGEAVKCNNYQYAKSIFDNEESINNKPWFGLEQEYFMITNDEKIQNNHGYHYCGKADSNIERQIAEEHMKLCVETGIQISGINSEVSKFQWEFQVGPCEGISAGDELIVARYLLERVAEKYNVGINYHPKPDKNINGSGCHVNFSSEKTRCENGINEINRCLACLSKNHNEIINFYGDNNQLRLTGFHETSSYDKFSWGIGTRNTSVRIPNSVFKENCGYFEDRRPASNIDPYLATSNLFKTCYLEGEHV